VSDTHAPDRCACGLAIAGSQAYAYNEEAFGYLLRVHRRRSERSDQPFLLLLVDLKGKLDQLVRIEDSMARLLFAALAQALRDNDLIGWYKEPYIAGAVLTECADGVHGPTAAVVTQRVSQALAEALSPEIAARFQVRICHIQPKLTS
jgi:hypothetical protein